MNSWQLREVELEPRLPEILSSGEAARAIVLDLEAGENLGDHEVHERAWLILVEGEIEVSTAGGEYAAGGAGLLVELSPAERHEVVATKKSRLLLLLTPWPGPGHPGAMTMREKLYARRHAAKRRV
jgi:quercetin dioxygenase-like cupin family protein